MPSVLESTVSRGGQTTVPAEVRRRLGIELGDRMSYVIADDGTVTLTKPKYPTLDSLQGAAGSLPSPMTWQEMKATIREERAAKYAHRD